jgi:hypothetical protein
MTDSKVTLEEVCEAWRREQKSEASGHLPTSTLFDLTRQSLSGDEHREAVQHLAECPACLQDLRQMGRIKSRILLVKTPLVAEADSPTPAPEVLPAHPPGRLLVG